MLSFPPMDPARATPAAARPRRGTAAGTRERLIAVAAEVFNREGYHGTDSNRLARAAGYAPATFYKHFPDKRAIFLAVYAGWVTAEWAAIEAVLRTDASPAARADRVVDMVVALHRRWRGLRASLRALVATDETARGAYRAQRRRQLRFLARLGGRQRARRAEADAVLLFTLERVADALADGEIHDLGLAVAATLARLRSLVLRHLEDRPLRATHKTQPPSSLTPAQRAARRNSRLRKGGAP
jgi:AcrR family transcriptional regulator